MRYHIVQDLMGNIENVSEHVDTYLGVVESPHRKEQTMRFYLVDSCEECPYLWLGSFNVRRCGLRDVIIDEDGVACEHGRPEDPCEFKGSFGIFKVIE